MFAIGTTSLGRPGARYAGERTMVHVRGKGGDRWLPGWPCRLLVGIGWGSSSWAGPVQARRLQPGEGHTDVTIGQITGLLQDLAATGKWQPGDPPPLVLLDAGKYATGLTHALAGHDVQLLVRLRSTRSSTATPRPGGQARWARHRATARSSPAPTRPGGTPPTSSAPRSAGCTVPWPSGPGPGCTNPAAPAAGPAGRGTTSCRSCAAPCCRSSSAISPTAASHPGTCGCGTLAPSRPPPSLLRKACLRRFGQEHFHCFAKSYLGLASAHLSPAAATGRRVALAMAAYAWLRLARHLADDLRRPWHPRPGPGKPLSPCKVRPGFRRLRARTGTPARSPKPACPGPGRPKGSKNRPKSKRPPYRKSEPTTSKHEE
jgi:hypothetical protein